MNTPGDATLQSGEKRVADQEIGDPGDEANNANREIGNPGESDNPGSGWHSRGYLPHFDLHELIQHVTFHLADSLPKIVVGQLIKEMEQLPAKEQDAERRKRIEAWIDAGHGSCVLREPAVAAMVQSALSHFDSQRYRLLAWVVMPNHVHVLFQPMQGWTVAKIVASWKKFTARRINEFKKKNRIGNTGNATPRSGERKKDFTGSTNREIGDPGRVWHREYWDRFMRDEQHYQQTVEYIHLNPVKAGLVEKAEGWRWSSASGKTTLRSSERKNDFAGSANREIGGPGRLS